MKKKLFWGIMIFFFALVSQPYAQNWVLWEDVVAFCLTCPIGTESYEEWNIISGFPFFEECLKVKESKCEESALALRLHKNYVNNCPDSVQFDDIVSGGSFSLFPAGTEITWNWKYKCLPDTIDPRK
jgi:hypothetical protein